MAKDNHQEYGNPDGRGGILDSIKGVLTIAAITGIGISLAYGSGRTVSDKVLREVSRERRKNEKEQRRELKERKKEARRQEKRMEKQRREEAARKRLEIIFKRKR